MSKSEWVDEIPLCMKLTRYHLIKFTGSGILRLGVLWLLLWSIKPVIANFIAWMPGKMSFPRLNWYFCLPDPPFIFGKVLTWNCNLWPLFLGLLVMCLGGSLMLWASFKSKQQASL